MSTSPYNLDWDSDTGLDATMREDTVWHTAHSGDRSYFITDDTDPDDGCHIGRVELWLYGERIGMSTNAVLDDAKDQAERWQAMDIVWSDHDDDWMLVERSAK